MTLLRLTHAEWVHLAGIKSYSGNGAKFSEMTDPYRTAVMSSLVRKGLVQSAEQSECVRGERRAYWRIYKITPEGLARLEAGPGNVTGADLIS